MKLMWGVMLAALLLAVPDGAAAGDEKKKAKNGKKETGNVIALKGAKVMTAAGRTFRRGTVLIRDGKIDAVGDDVRIPEDARVVDCTGKVITPGFIPATAWSIGLPLRGRGFLAEVDVDEIADDRKNRFQDPDHLYSYMIREMKAKSLNPATLEAMKQFLPDENMLVQAVLARLATQACPFLATCSEQDFLDPEGIGEFIKGSLDPHGRGLVWAVAAGITSAWVPSTRGVPGFAMLMGMVTPPTAGTGGATVKLTRSELKKMFISSGRFLVMDLRSMVGNKRYSLLKELQDTRSYLKEVAEYDKAKAQYTKDKARYKADKKAGKKVGDEPRLPKKVKKPGAASKWLPLFEKKRVLRVWAETVPQIRLALFIAERFGLEVVIDDAAEGWAIAAEIARAGASVVITPRRIVDQTLFPIRTTGPVYRHGSSIENAAVLSRAGVKVAVVPPAPTLVTMGVAGRDLLTFALDAGFAMRGGMDADEALRAITIHPATILGVDDRMGSLETGKDADLLVLDGCPFDHKTFVERTYVNGRLVYEKDKETLFDYVKRGKVVKPIWKWKE